MNKTFYLKTSKLKTLAASMLLSVLILSSQAHAVSGDQRGYIEYQLNDDSISGPSYASPRLNIYAQNRNTEQSSRLRSQSDVVREVKRKYNADVLKISLNKQRTAYRVRVLMPSGRVRDITVSAYQ